MKEEGGGGAGGGCNLCVCHIGSQRRRMGGRVEAREKGTRRDSLTERLNDSKFNEVPRVEFYVRQ